VASQTSSDPSSGQYNRPRTADRVHQQQQQQQTHNSDVQHQQQHSPFSYQLSLAAYDDRSELLRIVNE